MQNEKGLFIGVRLGGLCDSKSKRAERKSMGARLITVIKVFINAGKISSSSGRNRNRVPYYEKV